MNETPANGGDNAEAQQPPLVINGQYIKDLSFESPNSPGILGELQGAQPDVNVNVDTKAGKLEGADNVYEVVLDMRAELKVADKVGFLAELKYAGVFTINVPQEHLGPVLLIECPRMLFPFSRNILGDVTRDGGFVPLMLQPIDFAALYQQNLNQQANDVADQVAEMDKPEGNA
ncbi:protein-export chaperone SecB [Magnetovibrio sp. PR-2]|uniref:protein-export chaperone SecB n=1 Tax=Magnetovibrio sp. PR-2 TaxID=3120356 RepID=UPI002FCDEC75